MAKNIFIAATRQNDGKTVVSIGLVLSLCRRLGDLGFIKPVGQKYLLVNNVKVDKDAVLMRRFCGFDTIDLKDLNPVAVEESFTRRYLEAPDPGELAARIRASYDKIARDRDFVVIEGTGHAGVGSVFDMNNAQVARLLDAPAVIISIGGIGRPLDEIALNLALFRKKGVEVKGVIINKVLPAKKNVVEKYLSIGLKRMGVRLLGVIPHDPRLMKPNIYQICDCVKGKVLSGEGKFHQKVGNVVIGAMTPRHALDYFKPDSLLVTPGDREDLILAAITSHAIKEVIGVVLTGSLYPHKSILDLLRKFDIPAIIAAADTYETTSSIRELVVKITEKDEDKIELARQMVEENVDIDALIS